MTLEFKWVSDTQTTEEEMVKLIKGSDDPGRDGSRLFMKPSILKPCIRRCQPLKGLLEQPTTYPKSVQSQHWETKSKSSIPDCTMFII